MNKSLSVLILASSACLMAQDAGIDPPSRVARLNWIKGSVSFQPASLDTWATATVNYPLTTGDHIYTDRNARAEMHIGSNAIRLDDESNFGFLNLDDSAVQMRFTEGAMEIRLRHLDVRELWEVATPYGTVSLLRPGDYRFDTSPDRRAAMVTVSTGEAEIIVNGRTFGVRERQTGFFSDGIDPDIRSANVPDQFDRFALDRNLAEDRLPRSGHIPESMAGYEDVEGTGIWREAPEFGWVWLPPVDPSWVPYRDGRWVWVDPWGWTWVDNAPWGFAPFHYGRWAIVYGRWSWIPGDYDPTPVYAPALVVFAGGWGSGSVAWFPLGPREHYRPSYPVSDGRDRRMNGGRTNTGPVDRRFINRDVPGAAIAVSNEVFVSGRSIPSAATRISAGQLAGAQIDNKPGLPPGRESRLGGGRTGPDIARPNAPVQPVERPTVRPIDRTGERPVTRPEAGTVPDFSRDPIRRMDTRPQDSSGQPNLGQPNPGQPNPGQPNPGQPNPGQPNPGQPNPGQPNPGQPTPLPRRREIPQIRQPDIRMPAPEIRQAPEVRPMPQPRRIPEIRQIPSPVQVPQTPQAPPAPINPPSPPRAVEPMPQPVPEARRPPPERRIPKQDDHLQNDQ